MASPKRLRLRRADRCRSCERELDAGEEAFWDRSSRTVACLACGEERVEIAAGEPGASALREYERRRLRREQRARQKLGGLGSLLVRVTSEPQSTGAWRQGARGEVRVGARLAKHLDGHPVRLLHDRGVPGHGRANIDHLAIGPGGVTVINTKTHRGKIRVGHAGGLFSARRPVLSIAGRDQTRLVEGVERQVELVRAALSGCGEDDIGVRGALCFPDVDGLPLLGQLSLRGVVIDGPRPVAKLARRPGQLDSEAVDRVWHELAGLFPQA